MRPRHSERSGPFALVLVVSAALVSSGCGDESDTGGSGGGAPTVAVEARVVDPDGEPIADAWVMMGGQSQPLWRQTDAQGMASVDLVDDGWSDPWLLAGKEGWLSGGEPVDPSVAPAEAIEITMRPLPPDNPDYAFQPGGDGSSKDTSECGHCHWTIGDGWASSAHRRSAANPTTWDLYTGSAQSVTADTDCGELGGQLASGQEPGVEGQTSSRCYVDRGVLPWLNEGCGVAGSQGCDHPEQRDALQRFGECADCHAPAVTGGVAGEIDFAASMGVAFEGVTCDFCHKVRSVDPGPTAGLDGGITLLRPSEPTVIPGQQFGPIIFGPYPDVIVPIMNGSYSPTHREAGFCATCHEHARDALHPAESLSKPSRFPGGLPIQQTYGEFMAWGGSENLTCQGCHMPPIEDESSTYNISDTGLRPSVDQGWLREHGEVRHHHVGLEGIGAPGVELELAEQGGVLRATVTVTNGAAGHAVPTGEPLRQLLALVSAVDGTNNAVPAIGGHTIPDVGGAYATGTVGDDVTIAGSDVTFVGASLPATITAVRFVRPSGMWVDYAGPGAGPFSGGGLSAEDKGLLLQNFVAEIAVSAVVGDTLTLASAPSGVQPGDVAYAVGEGHVAGAAGWMFAKVLVDSSGRRGVAHYRAVDIASDNRIAAGDSATSVHEFPLPGGSDSLTVTVQVVRRRYAAPVADLYGWDVGDVEVSSTNMSWP